MKKVLKCVGITILVPILLFLLLAVLLYLPPVQNWAVKQVAAYASEKTGMDISVGHVRLEFPLDLGVEDVKVIQEPDTVAAIEKAVVNVKLWPLFRKQVEIDRLQLQNVKLNTTNMIAEARVKGTVGELTLSSDDLNTPATGIDLKNERLRVDKAQLSDANLHVALTDSTSTDTTETENRWRIDVGQLKLERSRVAVDMPGDTLSIKADLADVSAQGGFFDLGEGRYEVKRLDWKDGSLAYNNRYEKPVAGLDYNHIQLSDIQLGIDSLVYSAPHLNMHVSNASFKEKSGLRVEDISGPVLLDSAKVMLPNLHLKTSESELAADFEMDLNTFADKNPGQLRTRIDGTFGKQDIMRFLGGMPTDFVRHWPNQPLTVKGVASGNMNYINFAGLNVNLPTAFKGTASGYVANPTDMDKLRADINLDATTQNLDFIKPLLPKEFNKNVRIPNGIKVKGNIKANGPQYSADITAAEGKGTLKAKGNIDTRTMTYNAKLDANRLQLQHFVPNMGLSPFSGTVDVRGSGTDLLSNKTSLTAKANIRDFNYGGYSLAGMKADATVRNGHARADIDSNNPLLKGKISVDALMNTKNIKATIGADLTHADLYRLKLMDQPFTAAVCGHVDVATDMKDFYSVQGTLSDITIRDSSQTYRPEDMTVDILTRRDTTHAVVWCGDFYLNADASGGYKQLLRQYDRIVENVQSQIKNRAIDQVALRERLPNARLQLTSGKDNFLWRMLKKQGYEFDDAQIDMRMSPAEGINGYAQLTRLLADSIQLDTVRLYVESDSVNTTYRGQVRNNDENPQYTFNALFNGRLTEHGSALKVQLYDANDKLGVNLGANAMFDAGGIRMHLDTDNPILGYKKFDVNDDNYLYLTNDKRVSAHLVLKGDSGEGVQVYTNDDNLEALQDLTVSIHHFDLEKVLSVLPYTPNVTGMMDGDFHIIQTRDELSVSSSLAVDKLTYERNPMGNLSTEFVYMPREDGTHYIDGRLMSDDNEVGTIIGTYNNAGKGTIDANLTLTRLPLSLVNGFIPDQLFGLRGYAEGDISIKGSLSRPQVNGEVYLDSSYIASVPYGVEMRFANDPVRIVGSHLLFENFELFSHNENPLNVQGDIDFSNLDNIMMNVRMRAQNLQLIDSEENYRSVAFGKAFVNFFGRMSGPLNRLSMRGRLDVLGTTDMGYILRDTPLTTDNQLDELVKFVDFSDTTGVSVSRPPLDGFNMDMTIDVSKGAHIMAYLNNDHTNYIDLMGGGTLRMLYSAAENLRLNGRYTLSNGEMKYSLPIIPLKTFVIQDGSFLEFTGDPMNPTLNITATESTKATVTNSSGVGHSVLFDCGVIITKTLNDMGLEFTLDAPEDMSLHSELMAMSKEQRGKLAVSLLTTGMYLADGNTSAFSLNSALNTFLNTEINKISGNALRTLDLSFGVDNSTDASGREHTDYSFKFAKRFWNNHLKISVGGKVSTGSEIDNQNNSFFDNVTLEYRLDDTANKYVKMFFQNNAYDWIDGYTQQYGAGFIWRRSLQNFKDIFTLKSDKTTMPLRAPMTPNVSRPAAQGDTTRISVSVDSLNRKEP